jgi:hypothetical protein
MAVFTRDNVNRALIVALLVIWVVLWIGAIVVVLVSPAEAISAADNVVDFLDRNSTIYARLMFTVLGIVCILVALLLLVAEIAPGRLPAVRLTQVAGGAALLTTQAIVQRLQYEVEQLDQVSEAKPVVRSRGKGVNVRLDLRTAPDANVVEKTEEVCRVVQEVVEQMGVKLERPPTVYIQPEPLRAPVAARKVEAPVVQPALIVEEQAKVAEEAPKAIVVPAPEVAAETGAEDISEPSAEVVQELEKEEDRE